MRTMIGVYRQLGQFLDAVDAEAAARGKGPIDKTIDPHFRSGVYLGVGLSHIILSLMPGKLMTLVELFGYHGDRKLGLELLMKAGGWTHEQDQPLISASAWLSFLTRCPILILFQRKKACGVLFVI